MNLTTKERVKRLLALAPDEGRWDALLDDILASVSANVEDRLGRAVLAIERTEYYGVPEGTRRIFVNAYPVTAIDSIYNCSRRTFGAETLIDAALYAFKGRLVWFDYTLTSGFESLKIKYTGGMGATVAAFEVAYPAFAQAVAEQVAFDFENRKRIGLRSRDGRDASESRLVDSNEWLERWGNLLPVLVAQIKRHGN